MLLGKDAFESCPPRAVSLPLVSGGISVRKAEGEEAGGSHPFQLRSPGLEGPSPEGRIRIQTAAAHLL